MVAEPSWCPAGDRWWCRSGRRPGDGGVPEGLTGGPDRRFRAEAILELGLVRALGAPAQQGKAISVLNQLASGSDRILAEAAVWSCDTKLTKEFLRDAAGLTLLPPPAPTAKPR